MNPASYQKLLHWSLKGLNEIARMPVEIPHSFYRDFKALYNDVSRYFHDSRRTVPPANVAIEDVEIKALESGLHGPRMDGSRAVNIRDIERTGRCYDYGYTVDRDNTFTTYRHSQRDMSVNLAADDAFTRSLKRVYEAVISDIDHDEALQDLLAKPEWTREDRESWEDYVSNAVIKHLRQIPGIGSYRNPDDGLLAEFKNNAKQHLLHLNNLAKDIEMARGNTNRGLQYSFDCGPMAIVAGLQMQWLDRAFLPKSAPAYNDRADDYKYAANYFRASSKVLFDSNDKSGRHAYVVSSATGNVIEATMMDAGKKNISPYNISAISGYTFQDFANGVPFIGNDGALYNAKSPSDRPSEDTIKAINALYGSGEDLAHTYPHSEIPRIYNALPDELSQDTPEKYHDLIRIKNELERFYEQHRKLGCMFYMRSDREDDQSLYAKMRDREIAFVRECEVCAPQLKDDLKAMQSPEKVAVESFLGMRYELPFLLSKTYKERIETLKSQFRQYHFGDDADFATMKRYKGPVQVRMLEDQVMQRPESIDTELAKSILPYAKSFTGLEVANTMARDVAREPQDSPHMRQDPGRRSHKWASASGGPGSVA